MYEEAKILDYEGRKIWIKRVGEYLYLMNGCLFACGDVDMFDVDMFADIVDMYYSPWCSKFGENDMLSYEKDEATGRYIENSFNILDNLDKVDMDCIRAGRVEYCAWTKSMDIKMIYIDDRRGLSIDEYYAVLRAKGRIA